MSTRTAEQLEVLLAVKELELAAAKAREGTLMERLEATQRRCAERVSQADYHEALRQVELMRNRWVNK